MILVVDASVAAKWFLCEEDSNKALQILTSGLKLIGPSLAKYEVAGAISRRARDKLVVEADSEAYLQRWLHAVSTNVIRLEEDNRDIVTAHEIGMKLGHPLPDCIYLAMARRLDAPLVTADAVFAKKARKHYDRVFGIADSLSLST